MERHLLEASGQLDQLFAYVEAASVDSTPVHEVERAVFRGLLPLGRQVLLHFVQTRGPGGMSSPCI